MNMYRNRTLSSQNLEGFNFEETKRNVNSYFTNLEKMEWELAKLNAQKGLTVNYDLSEDFSKQPYISMGKDMFNVSAKELKEEEIKNYIANYYWAKSVLSDIEQIYIMEYFINRKYEDEIVDLLGFNNSDSNEFKKLKRSAVYKFADFLNLLAQNENREKGYGKKFINRQNS